MKQKYSIIKIKGSQFRVKEGDEILVNKITGTPDIDVLLYVDGGEVRIGKPKVSDVLVKVKVLGDEKGKKIDVIKFKAKSRYRRKTGFRPQYTRLLIEKISPKN